MHCEPLTEVELNAIERMVLDGEKGDRKTVVLKPRTARRLLDMLEGKEHQGRVEELEGELAEKNDQIEKLEGEIEGLQEGTKELAEAV